METKLFNFEKALELLKKGERLTRVQFNNSCFITAKYPDKFSKYTNTIPYIQMTKGKDCFPTDLSCESIFAEDRYIYHENPED